MYPLMMFQDIKFVGKIHTDYVSTGSLQILPNVLIIIHLGGFNRITICMFIELNERNLFEITSSFNYYTYHYISH